MAGHKLKSKSIATYGRHSWQRRLPRTYDLPASPSKKLQPRPRHPSLTSTASIARTSTVNPAHTPLSQRRAASNRSASPAESSSSSLHPQSTTRRNNALESVVVEASNQMESSPSNTSRLAPKVRVSSEPMSNKQIRAAEAAANEFSNPGISDDSVMTEEGHDVESDLPGAEVSQAHTTRDDEDEEYFDIEEIRSCKLSLRGMVLLLVKWKGYEDPADLTWEPERTLRRDVPHILDAYFEKQGGREKVLSDLREKRISREKGGQYLRKKGTARIKGRVSK